MSTRSQASHLHCCRSQGYNEKTQTFLPICRVHSHSFARDCTRNPVFSGRFRVEALGCLDPGRPIVRASASSPPHIRAGRPGGLDPSPEAVWRFSLPLIQWTHVIFFYSSLRLFFPTLQISKHKFLQRSLEPWVLSIWTAKKIKFSTGAGQGHMVSDFPARVGAAFLLLHTCSPYCLTLEVQPWLRGNNERPSLALG